MDEVKEDTRTTKTKTKICKLKDTAIEITLSEQQRKNEETKINRASGTYVAITKHLTFLSSQFQRRGERDWEVLKRVLEEITENFTDLAKT